MRFVNVDLLAALCALLWAILSTYQEPLATLCSPQIAWLAFLAMAGRGVNTLRNTLAANGASYKD